MENAADALKIAGYVLLFTMALTVAILTLSQGKAASEAIVYTKDKTNYYSFAEDDAINNQTTALGNRIVKLDSMIPILYNYSSEKYVVIIQDGSNEVEKLDLTTSSNTANEIRKDVTELVKRLQRAYSNATFEEQLIVDVINDEDDGDIDDDIPDVEVRTIKYTRIP